MLAKSSPDVEKNMGPSRLCVMLLGGKVMFACKQEKLRDVQEGELLRCSMRGMGFAGLGN